MATGLNTKHEKRKQRHLLFDKEWLVFPFAIIIHRELYYILEPTTRLEFHFLWWHWKWDFERKV